MNPLKLYINGRFLTQAITGVPRYARCAVMAIDELLAEGAEPSIDATLLVPRGAAVPPLKRIAVRTVGRAQGQAWEQISLPRAANDGVLLNLGNTAPLLHEKNVIVMYDAVIWDQPSSYDWRFRAWYSWLLPRLAARARAVVTVSHFSARALALRLRRPLETIAVIPGGADHLTHVAGNAGAPIVVALKDKPFVLAVLGATRHKNVAAVNAVASAIEPLGARMVVVQTAWHAARGAHITATNNIDVVSAIDDATLRELYVRAACLVHPSFYEGFGFPPLEAMSLGCPVVASDAAALPEVLGDAALYADPREPQSFAQRVLGVLNDGAVREQLATRGRSRAREYTWRGSGSSLLRIVRDEAASN